MTATPKGAAGTTSTPRKAVDWEAVERDYRTGLLTLRAIAEKHGGCSHVAIAKRAKAEGWARDLTAKIRAKAEEKVNSDAVNTQVNKADSVNERQIVEANATAVAEVIRGHRRQIGKAQSIAEKLLAELMQQTDDPELLVRLAEAGVDPDSENAEKQREAARRKVERSLALGNRVAILKTLSESMKNLIILERQAFRVDETPDEDPAKVDVSASVDDAMAIALAKIVAEARVPAE